MTTWPLPGPPRSLLVHDDGLHPFPFSLKFRAALVAEDG
jgi:hypothetical protein